MSTPDSISLGGFGDDDSPGKITEKPKKSDAEAKEEAFQTLQKKCREKFAKMSNQEGDAKLKFFLDYIANKIHIGDWDDLYGAIRALRRLHEKPVSPLVIRISVLITGWHTSPTKNIVPCPKDLLESLSILSKYQKLLDAQNYGELKKLFAESFPKIKIPTEEIRNYADEQLKALTLKIASILITHKNPSFVFFPKSLGENDGLEDFFKFAEGIENFTVQDTLQYKFEKYYLRFVIMAEDPKKNVSHTILEKIKR